MHEFDAYRPESAREARTGCVNNPQHAIRPGDAIGIAPDGTVCCAPCWARWTAENAHAARIEAAFPDSNDAGEFPAPTVDHDEARIP